MSSLAVALWIFIAACTAASSPEGPDAVASHLAALLNDSSPDIRRTAALSLGKIAVPEQAPALTQSLRDADLLVRQYSAWALGNLGEQALEEAGIGLAALLEDSSPAVAEAAAVAIGKIGASQRVLDRVTEALKSPAVTTRKAAVKAFAWLEAASTYPVLIQTLNDPDAEVRQEAIAALGELGDHRAVLALKDRLRHDPDPGVRSEAAYRLGKLGNGTVGTALQAAAESDPEKKVRRWAEWAIEQMGSSGGSESKI